MSKYEIKSTSEAAFDGLKLLVYGDSGVGKTHMIRTIEDHNSILLIDVEGGALTLQDERIPTIKVRNLNDLRVLAKGLLDKDPDLAHFKWICIDSLTEIADMALRECQETITNNMQVYGEMQKLVANIVSIFLGLENRHVYFTAKIGKNQDASGLMLYGPDMPGKKLGPSMPFLFDIVCALRVWKGDGEELQYLMTKGDHQYVAKDRSGALAEKEKPNLSHILKKVLDRRNSLDYAENNKGEEKTPQQGEK